jgi:preprotein translocase subunit SecE
LPGADFSPMPFDEENAINAVLGIFFGYYVKREESMKVVQFIKESYAELRKVVWPSRDDVISSVKVVIVSTLIIAAVLGLVDILLLLGVQSIF